MGLSSVFSTSVTGLQASETMIDVVGNNVANSQTVGFKESEAQFATQFLQTLGLGSAPTEFDGGTNPRQIGLGVQVAAITPKFTQGTLQISSNPSDLAIQGEGFFIVEGAGGEQLYTRNGKFQVNSQNELVTTTGDRLQGFGINEDYEIQTTQLTSLTIPLGSAAVAKATEAVFLEGTLTPTGDVADTAGVIQSAILGDAAYSRPNDGISNPTVALTDLDVAEVPQTGGVGITWSTAGGSTLAAPTGAWEYRIVFADAPFGSTAGNSTESLASTIITAPAPGGGNNQINLTGLDTSTAYSFMRIYRRDNGVSGSQFQYIGEQAASATTFADTGLAAGANLQAQDTLNGQFEYYVTFVDTLAGPPSGTESRPSERIGPLNVVNGRIQLTNLPTATTGPWVARRIYRNPTTGDATPKFVAQIDNASTTQTYTDTKVTFATTDKSLDQDGPRILPNTLLTNVLKRSDTGYEQMFPLGELDYSGRKGGRSLAEKSFTVTATSTVQDLMDFLVQSSGIQTAPGPDASNIIPSDAGSGKNPGAYVVDGRIELVSNNGVDNSVSIGLADLQITPTGASGPTQVALAFGSTQEAKGQSAVADFVVYDSLGIPLTVRVTAVLQERDNSTTTYRWFADSPDNDPTTGTRINVGTGLITFDGQGRFLSSTNSLVNIDRENVPSASPLEFRLDLSNLSGLADDKASLAATRQDGFPPGKLTSFLIGEDGTIRGVFDNGTERDLGQVRLARFANPRGLAQRGENLWAAGVNSGLPVQGGPGEQGIGSIVSGAVELSNTDIGKNLIDLILASTQYRGNTRVITTAQQLLDELLNLRR